MKTSQWLWGLAGMAALLSTALFIFGFVYAVNDILRPAAVSDKPSGELQQRKDPLSDGKIRVVAVGDSLTKGVGDESGRGYVGHVVDELGKRTGKPVTLLNNLAVSGYRTDQLLQDLQTKKGQAYALSQANLILFTIGGNDLAQSAQEQTGGDLTAGIQNIDPGALAELLLKPRQNMQKIIAELAEINPHAKIVYVGLYNPYYDLDETRQSNLFVQQWNADAYKTMNKYPNMTLVPSQDLFEKHITEYLASDHFHPNEAGYARIAERVLQALE